VFAAVLSFFLFCGRGTPLYKLYMFPREGFLSYFDVKMGHRFSHFDLKFGIVFKGTTQTKNVSGYEKPGIKTGLQIPCFGIN